MRLVAVGAALLAATGCAPSAAAPMSASTSHAVLSAGPGPTHYTVQPQPAAGSCHYRYTSANQPLPDAACTPGAVNPRVNQADIASTICRSGYTSSIRPPAEITDREKRANAASYRYAGTLRDAEYDHLVSLELGGDPNAEQNLWVEPPSPGHRSGSGPENPKDQVEDRLHSLVCAGQVPLASAQEAIAKDWTTALTVVGHPGTG
ncbi:hypothetical protein FOS14_22670 [Skermania sp. ID1734]|nr:hypothetical protein FOS14_22670 [Skermania sp. ID1734]